MIDIFEIEFEWIYLLLLPLLFILFAWLLPYRPGRLYFAHTQMIGEAKSVKSRISVILKWLTILLASLALASPVIVNKEVIKKSIGYDMAVAIDASGSMRYPFADDRTISKFDVTKRLSRDFVAKREADNLGAVAFGRYAFILSPLTFDKKALQDMMDQVQMSPSFSQGTAIGEAIAQSVRLLKGGEAKNRMIVLITDGDEEGDVSITFDKATDLAKKYGIKIYTIGIGRRGEYNERLLRYVSSETGGSFFAAHNKNALKEVFGQIDALEKSQITTHDYVKKEYFYAYPLFIAILSLLGYIYFRQRAGAA